jgi:hypothetical protein
LPAPPHAVGPGGSDGRQRRAPRSE